MRVKRHGTPPRRASSSSTARSRRRAARPASRPASSTDHPALVGAGDLEIALAHAPVEGQVHASRRRRARGPRMRRMPAAGSRSSTQGEIRQHPARSRACSARGWSGRPRPARSPGRPPSRPRSGRRCTTAPRASAGAMTRVTCCWRAAMKRKVWVSGVGVGPSASNRARIREPERGAVGLAGLHHLEAARSSGTAPSRAHWVDLPEPSTPSTRDQHRRACAYSNTVIWEGVDRHRAGYLREIRSTVLHPPFLTQSSEPAGPEI